MNQAATNSAHELERTQRYLASDPGNPLLLGKTIDLCLAAGRVDDARRYAEDARRAHPDNAQLANRFGHVLLAQGRAEEAAALFEKLFTETREANVAYNLALARFRAGHFAQTRAALEPYVAATPAWPPAVTLCLRALHQLDELTAGLDVIEAHASACASNAEFLGVASLLSLDADRQDEAARLSASALATGQRPLEALIAAGSVALANGEPRAASALFSEVLASLPSEGRSWAGLGVASLLSGNIDAAKDQLETAVQHMPSNVNASQMLAWCHIARGELPLAREVLGSALARDGDVAGLHGTMAVVCALQGDAGAARANLARASRLDPEETSIHYATAILSGGAGDLANLNHRALQALSARGWRLRK